MPGEAPDPTRRTGRAGHSDSNILELAGPGRSTQTYAMVPTHVTEDPPDERMFVQALRSASNSNVDNNTPDLRVSFDAWASKGETHRQASLSPLLVERQELLRQYKLRQEAFAIAIQHFEMHNQFFTSSCDRAYLDKDNEVAATFEAVRRAGNEMFAPQRNYTSAVTKFRHFVVKLLEQLPTRSDARSTNTSVFNDLSHVYEDREIAIREEILNICAMASGNARQKVELYMKAFKSRGELLGKQQTELDSLAKECLKELGEDIGGI